MSMSSYRSGKGSKRTGAEMQQPGPQMHLDTVFETVFFDGNGEYLSAEKDQGIF